MATQTVIDSPQGRLSFDTDKRIVHHRLGKNIDSQTLRAVLDGGIELIKTHKATKWLSDNRAINAHSDEDTRWINTDWLPRVIKAGWKYWALVVPDDFIARINMVEFVDSFYNQGVRVMVFTDINEAWQWLESVDQN
jgi:hypothetical protein